jgi:hypothetical protein
MSDELKHLNKDDLYLLMESYRNMIDMHNTLVNQQKSMLENQGKLTDKQELTLIQHNTNLETLSKISNRLDASFALLDKISKDNESISGKISTGIDKIRETLSSNHLDTTKQNSALTNKVYIAMIGMATIMLAMIGMGIGLIEKFSLLKDVHVILSKIASYFAIIK